MKVELWEARLLGDAGACSIIEQSGDSQSDDVITSYSIHYTKLYEKNFEIDDLLISLMSQYTPFYRSSEFPEINRRISTFEYNKVLDKAISLGLKGYMQEKSSAKEEYTPDFDLTGIKKPE